MREDIQMAAAGGHLNTPFGVRLTGLRPEGSRFDSPSG